MTIKFVRRDDVRDRLLAKWAEAIKLAEEVGLSYYIPNWDRLRNYEMEALMRDNFGDDGWVVCEWCPFDGVFCTYRYGASRHDLKSAQSNIAAWRPERGMPDLNKPYLFGLLDDELAKRPVELGERQCWGQGVLDYLEEIEAKERRRLERTLEVTA